MTTDNLPHAKRGKTTAAFLFDFIRNDLERFRQENKPFPKPALDLIASIGEKALPELREDVALLKLLKKSQQKATLERINTQLMIIEQLEEYRAHQKAIMTAQQGAKQ